MPHMSDSEFNTIFSQVRSLMTNFFWSVKMPASTFEPFYLECLRRDLDPGPTYGEGGNLPWVLQEGVRYGDYIPYAWDNSPEAWKSARDQYAAYYGTTEMLRYEAPNERTSEPKSDTTE